MSTKVTLKRSLKGHELDTKSKQNKIRKEKSNGKKEGRNLSNLHSLLQKKMRGFYINQIRSILYKIKFHVRKPVKAHQARVYKQFDRN